MVSESRFVIRSTMVDTFGHLNNSVYLELYEWARWEWWKEKGIDLSQFQKDKRRAPAILRADLQFLKEITLGQVVCVRTRLSQATRARAVFAQEMTSEEGVALSSIEITFVLLDVDSRRPVPMARNIIALKSEAKEG